MRNCIQVNPWRATGLMLGGPGSFLSFSEMVGEDNGRRARVYWWKFQPPQHWRGLFPVPISPLDGWHPEAHRSVLQYLSLRLSRPVWWSPSRRQGTSCSKGMRPCWSPATQSVYSQAGMFRSRVSATVRTFCLIILARTFVWEGKRPVFIKLMTRVHWSSRILGCLTVL